MGTVDVVLSGNILPGAELAEATAQFASLTGLSQEQARELISSGRERIVKRGVSATVGQKYLDKLSSIGAEARLRSATVPAPPTGTDPQSGHQAADQFSSSPPPSTGSVAVQAGQTTTAPRPISPYSAPKAETSDRRDRLAGTWRGTAATVPASHGYHWLKDAWTLFSRRKGTWIGTILLVFFISAAVSAVLSPVSPLLSNIVTSFLWPLFAGGIAIMAHRQTEGEAIDVLGVFAGFKRNTVQLLLIGLFALVYGGLVVALGLLMTGQDTLMALTSGKQQPGLVSGLAPAIISGMILCIPLMLSSIIAPTLVSLAGESAFAGLYKGFLAGLNNWSAFLVNGLVLFLVSGGVAVVAGLFFGLAFGLFGGPSMMTILAIGLAALFLFLPLIAALSLMPYTASRDIFYNEA